MKYLQVNDIHSADRPPRWRTDSYVDDVFAKLAWVAEYATQQLVDFIALTGDVFHLPTPSRVSHALVQRWWDLLDEFGTWLIVPGNHDVINLSETAIARSPLGVLARHPNAVLLWGENACHRTSKGAVVGIGWEYDMTPEKWTARVTAAQLPYTRWPEVILAHAAIADPNPFYPTLQYADLAGTAKVISHGHLHAADVREVAGTHFVNPGALVRGSIAAEDMSRVPSVALVETKPTVRVELVPVPVARPADEVYRLEAVSLERAHSTVIQEFVDALKFSGSGAAGLDVMEEIRRTAGEDTALAELCLNLLTEVS